MKLHSLVLVTAVFVAVVLGTVVGAVYAVSVFNKPLNTQVRIVSEAGFSYHANRAATVPLTDLDLGDLVRGEKTLFTFYIKNTSAGGETVSSGPSTLPSDVGTLSFTFDGQAQRVLASGEVSEVQGTLDTQDDADPGNISFTLSVNAAPVSSGGSPAPTPVPGNTSTPVPTPAGVSYASTIQPIFNASCIGCHGSSGGVTLTGYSAAKNTVVAGNASSSLLYKAVTGNGATKMPMGGTLSAAQIQSIADWINQGALNN